MILPRFYPILDTAALKRRDCDLGTATESLLEAGCAILQLRHKANYTREIFNCAKQMAEQCRAAGALLVINDRADIAVMLDCALHVGQSDLPPSEVRPLLGTRVLGYSTHNQVQLESSESEPIDYIAFGPVFATVSKQNPDPTVGLFGLMRLRPLCSRPLVAIGGITRQMARGVLDAGADSIAIISDLLPQHCTKAALRDRAQEWIELTR
jgi:thiamine-phosphate pyrophosphorylase